jgi:subtilase family serine protease
MPFGAGACPPPINHEVRDLAGPFRDSATVLFDGGRLSGNNAHVFRGNSSTEGALGTFDGTQWLFDFPFNSADSAETALFFALNFAHDFFYELGFDEAAGNFQVDNFGRGGLGGDPIRGLARASGRNNASFQLAPDGTSPIIRMFLWDGRGSCWAEDVDDDGVADIDGDFDTDILLHEFHHGVSTRLNTTFTGNEAGAIGEGGSDFFAYSINGDTLLAEYAYPGGLRRINEKTYNDWTCQLGFFCEVHDNGEIFANVLWDVRERFRLDLVRGSDAAAINEVHQLYVDALALSPPAPTMLDLRDAMLQADALRNPGTPVSANFCALWEPFATRGMGVNATDTKDNGLNQVHANFSVPPGCQAPPSPPLVTLAVTDATATEAGPTAGVFTISREAASAVALTVNFMVAGTATRDSDYVGLPTSATIPAGALSVDVEAMPIDDSLMEQNETVTMTLLSGAGYVLNGLATGAVTIVSDDVAPDFTLTALTAPALGGAGLTLNVSDTTRNQGTGPGAPSTTVFYLSANTAIEATDPVVGSRQVPALAAGASDTGSTVLTIPDDTSAGQYWLIAKADGPGAVAETAEINNTRYALVKIGPDLTFTAMTAPATAGPGATIVVNETTKNQGAGAADASSSTRFYLSTNFSFEPGDTELDARSVPPLAPGASSSAATYVTIPTTAPSGTLYLIAVADDARTVAEQTETNNTRFLAIRIGPDLFVSGLTAPTRAGSGSSVAVTDTTKNTGGGASGPSTTAFYLSANLTLDAGDTRMSTTRAVGPLDAGAQSVGTTNVTLPAVAPGTWYLMANADDTNDVIETVETNNLRYTTIYIGPDLTMAAVNAPNTAIAGTSITISDTTKNVGPDVAAPSTTRFYLSLNGAVDAGDILLDGTRSVPALGFNAISTGTTLVNIPSGLSGRYFLLAVADDLAAVAEASETNNLLLRFITINP